VEQDRNTVRSLVDEFTAIASGRALWDRYWREIASFVLPSNARFDTMLSTSPTRALNSVVDTPAAAERSKNIYDMTSIWAIERLTTGLLTLKTPESAFWHELNVDSDYGYEASHDEKEALERLRNYLFKIRGNPKSGFWAAHKAAMRSMCAFGDGWMFVEELHGHRTPFRYEYIPLAHCYPANGPDGQPNRMFRVFDWSAAQIMQKWPKCTYAKIVDAANDVKRRHETFRVMHAVRPRSDSKRSALGVAGSGWESWYVLPEEHYVLAKGGYYEFPFIRFAWANNGTQPYCEGPVAIALGEIKSINEMAKNELLSAQMMLRPPLGVIGKNMQRLNFNAGAVNPGLVNPDGRPLFAPLNAGARPDFAATIMEQKRNALREMLYVNLWQILIEQPGQTATEALIRAQEKGELLGPVGISMNEGLSAMVDREVGILGRKGAFRDGSPLAMPESTQGREVSPEFTSPLDRLRRVNELIGIQRLLEMATALAPLYPEIKNRMDPDEIIEKAQEILGAPVSTLVSREDAQKRGAAERQQADMMAGIGAMEAGGNAAAAMGSGAQAMAAGAQNVTDAAPNLQSLLANLTAAAQQPGSR
jgi:hypothetical protein